jgi:His-Xaa-Ser system protein HxsD
MGGAFLFWNQRRVLMTNLERRGVFSRTDGEKFLLKLSKQFYERPAVMAAAYKFTDRCTIIIEPLEEGYVGVWFQAKNNEGLDMIPDLINDFCNEVLDQQVRLDLEKRYGNLRDTIVKHAFQPLEHVTKGK